jgi:hypothetical protein
VWTRKRKNRGQEQKTGGPSRPLVFTENGKMEGEVAYPRRASAQGPWGRPQCNPSLWEAVSREAAGPHLTLFSGDAVTTTPLLRRRRLRPEMTSLGQLALAQLSSIVVQTLAAHPSHAPCSEGHSGYPLKSFTRSRDRRALNS